MKPATLTFGVDERPGPLTTVISALQHVGMAAVTLPFPLLVLDAAKAGPDQIRTVLTTSLLALGLATILQCGRWGPIGSGYLAPAVFTAVFLQPCILAASIGGLGLAAGMLMFGGLIELLVAALLRRFPPLFPPEISGFAVLFIGVELGLIGFRLIYGTGDPAHPHQSGLAVATGVAAVTLAATVALSVWGRGGARTFCALIGMLLGVAASLALGDFAAGMDAATGSLVWPVAWPRFDLELAPLFCAAGLAAALRVVGDVTTCQKINDADWSRPEMRSVRGGILADGLGNVLAGLLNTTGLNTYSGSIGLAAATGVAARRVGYLLGALYIVLAFVPGLPQLLELIPTAVIGAALMFISSFIILNGIQIVAQRVLDARMVIAIGFGLMLGLSRDVFPGVYDQVPPLVRPLVQSSLVVGLLTALGLNALFRIGVGRVAAGTFRLDAEGRAALLAFLGEHAAAWAIPQDSFRRAETVIGEFQEIAAGLLPAEAEVAVELAHDEFTLTVGILYAGPPLEGSAELPDPDSIVEDERALRRFALALIHRTADRVSTDRLRDGRQRLRAYIRI